MKLTECPKCKMKFVIQEENLQKIKDAENKEWDCAAIICLHCKHEFPFWLLGKDEKKVKLKTLETDKDVHFRKNIIIF